MHYCPSSNRMAIALLFPSSFLPYIAGGAGDDHDSGPASLVPGLDPNPNDVLAE